MNTTEKGNKLEDQLYDYLHGQLVRGKHVFDVYPANLCEVHKKRSTIAGIEKQMSSSM